MSLLLPRLEWWQDARFGLFLHWGPYSVPAGVWKGRTNPTAYDADAWTRLAREAASVSLATSALPNRRSPQPVFRALPGKPA